MRKPVYLPLIGASLFVCAAAVAQEEQVVLPRNLTLEEQQAYDRPATAGDVFIWECFPELAGFTKFPPDTSRFPTEAEQTRGAMYGWPSYGHQMTPLTELIRNSVQQDGYETTVMVPSNLRAFAETTLRNRGFDDLMISRINWFNVPLDGIWIRDYGAEVLVTPDGTPQFVDMGYYSGPGTVCPDSPEGFPRLPGRPSDDVSPTRFAPYLLSGVDVFRPPLRTEGGNLQTDGYGTCVHMQREVLARNNFSRWMYTQEQLDDVYRNYFNCPNVISLESLRPDPGVEIGQRIVIDHVDMLMTFISARTETNPGTVLVARLDPEDAAFDPDNAAILDRNAQTLVDAGYNVIRIPQPARYCTLRRGNNCIANADDTLECVSGSPPRDRVWATYANSMRVGNRMLVPIYRDPVSDGSPLPQDVKDRIMRQETEALTTYQTALDNEFGVGAVEVVPVVSDDMIPCQGSMHCISMTYGQ
jgi:agmatine/peptidylarginine deiminase